ncbi:hypothetical protein Tco_0266417 [Tanacetum coccineum]
MVPRVVLIKSGLVSVNTARQVNVAHSKTTVNAAKPVLYLSKKACSTVKRPIHKNTTFKNKNFNQMVNTIKGKNVNTARPKAVVNAVKGNNVNAVKASACWVWKPKTKVLDHGNPQVNLQDQGVIDSGCSRHMTRNMSYLTDYEEIDEGYVAFGGHPKEGKITRKCTIKTDQEEMGEGSKIPTNPHHIPTIVQPSTSQPQKKQKPWKPKKKDTQIPESSGPTKHVANEAVYKELDDSLVRAATTASSLEAEQDSGSGPRCQETMGDTIAQIGFEKVSKLSNDLLLARESSRDEESLGEDASKLGRINDIDADEDITLVNDQDDADVEMVDVMVKKCKKIVIPTYNNTTISTKDKGKGIMVEEPVKMKKKDQISFDEQEAKKLQAEFDEEERLAREKAQQEQESNVSLTEEWDDIQAKVDADYQLAQRLQAEEKEEFSVEEKAKSFQHSWR